MRALTLYIADKNHSSWSLRAWLFLRHVGLAFEEVHCSLGAPDFAAKLTLLGAPPRVPVLTDGALVVWDSLAICEYASEITGRGLPRDVATRAIARSVSAEMHSSFQALRQTWPMNVHARRPQTELPPALEQDIARVEALWGSLRAAHCGDGPWLFGEWSLADAMYAPVVLRFVTYGAVGSAVTRDYAQTTLGDPLLQEWIAAAERERR